MQALADGINFPIVAAWGLVVYTPLTLLVSGVECGVLRALLRLPLRKTFGRVLIANIVSTLLGGVVALFDRVALQVIGITTSIPDFVSGYVWAALIMIGVYFAKSVGVEGLIVASKRFAAATGRTRMSLFKAMCAGNIASYCVVGPLYYFSTKPEFGNAGMTADTRWTANPDVPAYFIEPETSFIQRIRLDGTQRTTVVPYPAAAFQMSGDATMFAFRGADGSLYAYRIGDARPILAWQAEREFQMRSVSLSPGMRRIAFAQEPAGDTDPLDHYRLAITDLETGEHCIAEENGSFGPYFFPAVAWSADGSRIFVGEDTRRIAVYQTAPRISLVATWNDNRPTPEQLADNYVRPYDVFFGHWKDEKRGYRVVTLGRAGGLVTISRNGREIWRIDGGYGLLGFSIWAPAAPTILPKGKEVLLEWRRQLYILDFEGHRLGLLTDGSGYLIPAERFRPQLTLE